LFHAHRLPRLITAECNPGGIEEIGQTGQVRYASDFNMRERRSVRPRFPAQVASEIEDHQRLGFIRFKAGRGEARSQIWRKIVTVDLPLNGAVFARDGPARGPGVPIAGIGLEREPTKKRHLLGNGGVCRIGRQPSEDDGVPVADGSDDATGTLVADARLVRWVGALRIETREYLRRCRAWSVREYRCAPLGAPQRRGEHNRNREGKP
jgi:hypothetical protein